MMKAILHGKMNKKIEGKTREDYDEIRKDWYGGISKLYILYQTTLHVISSACRCRLLQK